MERFEEKISPEPNTGCWIWVAATHTQSHIEYGSFRIYADQNPWRAHRASWELHVGTVPDDLCVLHKCDNGLCVNPAHLFLGTTQDNNADKMRKGRQPYGEAAGRTKLTRNSVRAAYMSIVNGEPELSVARRLKVSIHHVWCIRMGWVWARDTADLRAAHPLPTDLRWRTKRRVQSWEAA